MRIAVLISGGVDSAVAVHRICEMGYKPDLFYIKIGMEGEGLSCTAEEDIELSTATARRYGLHLEVVDLQKQYWELVVGYAMERARRGLTPNPDVMCNKLIKFHSTNVNAFSNLCNSGISRCAIYFVNLWTFRHSCSNCMFSSTASNYKYFHFLPLSRFQYVLMSIL